MVKVLPEPVTPSRTWSRSPASATAMLRPRSFDVILGLTLLSYAVNLFIFSTGGLRSGAAPSGLSIAADPSAVLHGAQLPLLR